MICPHCNVSAGETGSWKNKEITNYDEIRYSVGYFVCVECHKISIKFVMGKQAVPGFSRTRFISSQHYEKMLVPETSGRKPIPKKVEDTYRHDYDEAVRLLPHSASASAIFSRRVLQHYIRKKHNIKKGDLEQDIQELAKQKIYDSEIIELFSFIRHYGKFAAHTSTDYVTGELIDVDNEEAEALLIILEQMFDYDYARMEKFQDIKKQLNEKMKKAKPPQKNKSKSK
ncbi:MAG: DUF4145 domain-containing protein [Nitrosopumilus sp.]|nr:DUF4145 domain-containing protein [Nitrosopumilus sp.]